jgi:hypothetical protein
MPITNGDEVTIEIDPSASPAAAASMVVKVCEGGV